MLPNGSSNINPEELVRTHEQAVEFLHRRINYERLSGADFSGTEFKLDRMREFLRRLQEPQRNIPAVHITGTKGKGSTAAMVASVLRCAGYRTGLFTSPHLTSFEERMLVDGQPPDPEAMRQLVQRVVPVVAELDRLPVPMSPTFFELLTALAWLYYQQREVQLAVMEVGLGGRLDATNVCEPEATAITTISRDHTRQLGSRVEQIAWEKSGIAKPGVPMVVGRLSSDALDVVRRHCAEIGAPVVALGHDYGYTFESVTQTASSRTAAMAEPCVSLGSELPVVAWCTVTTCRGVTRRIPLTLWGEHQAHNAAVAVQLLELLAERGWNVTPAAYEQGFSQLRWPGRIEVVRRSPVTLLDTAHNWAAARALVETLQSQFPARRRLLVFAATRDKDVAGMLRQLLPVFDTVVLTQYQASPRRMPVGELASLARSLTNRPLHVVADSISAWKLVERWATPADCVCITGSFYIAAELRDIILESRVG